MLQPSSSCRLVYKARVKLSRYNEERLWIGPNVSNHDSKEYSLTDILCLVLAVRSVGNMNHATFLLARKRCLYDPGRINFDLLEQDRTAKLDGIP